MTLKEKVLNAEGDFDPAQAAKNFDDGNGISPWCPDFDACEVGA